MMVDDAQKRLDYHIADGVFDDPLDEPATAAFLDDPNHRLAIALDSDLLVGFASAVRYLHPDKPAPELWINEIGLAKGYRRRGLGGRLLQLLFDDARRAGCAEAWVLAEASNEAAVAFYRSLAPCDEDAHQIMFKYDLA